LTEYPIYKEKFCKNFELRDKICSEILINLDYSTKWKRHPWPRFALYNGRKSSKWHGSHVDSQRHYCKSWRYVKSLWEKVVA